MGVDELVAVRRSISHSNVSRQLGDLLQGTVVSGVEKMHKPNADIYELALSRFNLRPESSVFFDDTAKNVTGAQAVGMHAFRFTNAGQVAAI